LRPDWVTSCSTSLTFTSSSFCPHSVFMCFVWISEQTAIISLYNINWLVCITETECLLRGTDWISRSWILEPMCNRQLYSFTLLKGTAEFEVWFQNTQWNACWLERWSAWHMYSTVLTWSGAVYWSHSFKLSFRVVSTTSGPKTLILFARLPVWHEETLNVKPIALESVETVNVLQLVYVTVWGCLSIGRCGRCANISGRRWPENEAVCGISTVYKIVLVIGVTRKRNACLDWWKNLKEWYHLVDPEVVWTWFIEKEFGIVWIGWGKNWCDDVNRVMNLQFP
jgi:hypothetical protein